MKSYHAYLVSWLRKKLASARAKGFIFGLSGGVDSALVASLLKEAAGERVLAVLMPIERDNEIANAQLVVNQLGIPSKLVDLSDVYRLLTTKLELSNHLARINLMPRLRMLTLYALGQERQFLVVGTTNRAEWNLGYFTKHGDSGADLFPLLHLSKTQVWQLARELKVPEKIIQQTPSANLYPGQSDEKELGLSYLEIDAFLAGESVSVASRQKIQDLVQTSAHKREPISSPLSPEEFANSAKGV
ncbi:NAD(+) synthase [Mycoplasma sp. ATU-Cv-508]|uniref:NAD(+) synthase n=1 Tax=Mycoplasma sp. ATU-Cv-508 TaxID=2048001 RepID=UPI000FDCEBBD